MTRLTKLTVFGNCCAIAIVLNCSSLLGQSPTSNETARKTQLITALKSVGKFGKGNENASRAMLELNKSKADAIPELLNALNGTTPLQRNWIVGVINRAARVGALPRDQINAYLENSKNDDVGRMIAFELLTQNDEKLANVLIPTFINDLSLPLRYKAIARLIDRAESLESTDPLAIDALNKAFNNALNVNQMKTIAQMLVERGQAVNLQKQMGFLNRWSIVGTFDNTESEGFDVAFGPEETVAAIDLKARYKSVTGESVAWQSVETDDDTGVVNLNEIIGNLKDRSVYAFATFDSPVAGPAQLRLGTPNATKIWLNGELRMVNEVYHNSDSIDKFVGDVNLSLGANTILIKVCQNNQTQSWAQDWQFQLRICGPDSKPIIDPSFYTDTKAKQKDTQ